MAGGEFMGGLLGAGGDIIGGLISANEAQNVANENIAYQEEFAKNGIQWRVADAKAAGINPLAALGASTTSFSNVVGDQGAVGKGIAAAGQNLGRAVTQGLSPDDQAYVDMHNRLTIQQQQLQNDLIGTQIALAQKRLTDQPGNGPPLPNVNQNSLIPGQEATNLPTAAPSAASFDDRFSAIKMRPSTVTAGMPGNPQAEAGVGADLQYGATRYGLYPGLSADNQKSAFNTWYNMAWSARNQVAPMLESAPWYVKLYMDRFHPGEGPVRFDPVLGYYRASPGIAGYFGGMEGR